MKSWKTTVAGVIALGGTLLAQFFPEFAKLGGFLAAFGSGAGLLFARDNNVTSEQAGAGVTRQADDKRQGALPLSVLLCLPLSLGLLLSGCSGPAGYKAAAVTVTTAEHASDAWLDYYVVAKKLPGADLNKLAVQNSQAEKAWKDYQLAMESVYSTRLAVASGTKTDADLAATLKASQDAAGAVVRLVLNLLPPERATKLKGPL